ncbi:hypothetical protein [Streptomyces viridochromogenes]|uniref:hypothetical protein n=1 Tax=Streptomyces viridochromogenes TaxID=1938 RepID=UPI001319F64E|nr:hypothetical protein [Streptomyces viridochromogenes]
MDVEDGRRPATLGHLVTAERTGADSARVAQFGGEIPGDVQSVLPVPGPDQRIAVVLFKQSPVQSDLIAIGVKIQASVVRCDSPRDISAPLGEKT